MFHSVRIREEYVTHNVLVEGGSNSAEILRKVVRDERDEAQHGSADLHVLGGGAHPGPVLRPRHPHQPLHRPRPRHGGQGR